jgi:hypothetical protein
MTHPPADQTGLDGLPPRWTAQFAAELPDTPPGNPVAHPDELLQNLDGSLRVHNRAQFFNWTQGLLQSLVRHRLLACALPATRPEAMHAEVFSLHAADTTRFAGLFAADALGLHLLRSWQSRRHRPLVWDLQRGEADGQGWRREFEAIGATRLIAHGMHDARGAMSSFFVFACETAATGARQLHAVELAVPFLHAAWMRLSMNALLQDPEGGTSRRPTC